MKKHYILASTILAFAACTPAPEQTTETAPLVVAAPPLQVPAIAVLEHNPGALADDPAKFVVRFVFQNSGDGWKSRDPGCRDEACLANSAATWPPTAAWTIVHAGAVVGKVDATTPKAWTRYADVGTQQVASTAEIPKVGVPTRGWVDSDQEFYRPLVAISRPTASDPEGWKDAPLAPVVLGTVQGAFTAQFNDVSNCESDGGTEFKPMKYKPADIAIAASYTSTTGWVVATSLLTDYRCDGPPDSPFLPQTFAISPDLKIQYLGESLQLVDAGDFDGNGKSELLFAIQRGNTGGYELHFDDFAGHATFAYSHH